MVSYDETVIKSEVRIIGTLARGLYHFLEGLSEAELSTQSACDAWTARDVAGHLTNRAERQLASMTRGRSGDSAPPAGFSAPSDNMAMSAANADADIEYSQSLGDALVPTFAEKYQELHRLLDSFSDDDWRCDCWHPRRGSMTAREYVSQRIQELAVHDWDIRSGLDSSSALHPDAVPVLLGMSAHWLRSAYNPGAQPPLSNVKFRFALYDADAMDVLVTPDGATAGVGLHEGSIDLTVECDANTYLLLAYGRLDLVGAVASGRIRSSGAIDLLDKFVGWMVGF
jgi:uncharacterized protein (TIGR03083 family)